MAQNPLDYMLKQTYEPHERWTTESIVAAVYAYYEEHKKFPTKYTKGYAELVDGPTWGEVHTALCLRCHGYNDKHRALATLIQAHFDADYYGPALEAMNQELETSRPGKAASKVNAVVEAEPDELAVAIRAFQAREKRLPRNSVAKDVITLGGYDMSWEFFQKTVKLHKPRQFWPWSPTKFFRDHGIEVDDKGEFHARVEAKYADAIRIIKQVEGSSRPLDRPEFLRRATVAYAEKLGLAADLGLT